MSAGQEIGSPIRENRTLLPAPLPPDDARGTLAAAAGVSTVGLRPPFDTPAAAFSSCLSRHSHPDCRAAAVGKSLKNLTFGGENRCSECHDFCIATCPGLLGTDYSPIPSFRNLL